MVSLFGRGFKSRQLHTYAFAGFEPLPYLLFRSRQLHKKQQKISTDCQWIFFI